jgi:hypothetical protein
MDAAKKPESLLAGGALVTALTTAIYLNKQQNSLNTRIGDVESHLASTISELKQDHDALSKHDKHITILADGVRQLNTLKIEQSELFEYFYQVLMDRGKVIEALVESVSEIQSIMVENGTEFKNGSIRDLVDFSEQDSLADMPKNNNIQRSRQIPLDHRQANSSAQHNPRMNEFEDGRFDRIDRNDVRENDPNMGDIRNRFDRHDMIRGGVDMDQHKNNVKQDDIGNNNRRSSLPQIDDSGDSDDEIEAQMNAMRSRRNNQLNMG